MSNNGIREYLDFYTKHQGHLEYAILLDGEWGAGKTYFIKNYIAKNDPKKFYFVSLYGLKDVEEIDKRFIQLSFPALENSAVKAVKEAFTALEYNGFSFDITRIKFENFLKRNKESIIVFDDLERCEISINTVLGYINHLVEHEGSKVIILAHEEKIIPDEKEPENKFAKYKEIKEKLIGRTFTISAELEPALNNFIESIQNAETKKALKDNINTITHIYNVIGYQNLRSLRQVTEEFGRLYELLPDKAKKNTDIIKEILNSLMIFLFEQRKGLIETEDLLKLSETSIYYLSSATKKKDEERSNIEKFFKKYSSRNFYELCPSDYCWFEFFKYGKISDNSLNESISNSKYYQNENMQDWVKLWRFHDIEEIEFIALYEKVKKRFLNEEFRDPGILKHIAGLLIYFSKEGLVKQPIAKVVTDIKKTLKKINDKNILIPKEIDFDRHNSFAGLGYFANDTKEFKEISTLLTSYVVLANEREYPNIAKKILGFLSSEPKKFREALSTNSENFKISNKPIFKYIDPKDFVDSYLKCPNNDKNLISYALKDRYDLSFHYPELLEEFDCINKIDKKLKSLELKSTPFNKYRIFSFREYTLKPALNKMTEAKKHRESKT